MSEPLTNETEVNATIVPTASPEDNVTELLKTEAPKIPDCVASRLWVGRNECDEMSVSSALLVALVFCWAALFVVAGLRLIKLTKSSATNTDVAKKMQFFQAWFYSLFYTIVSVVHGFIAVHLFLEEEFITGTAVLSAFIASTAYCSQIDVIGTVGRKSGINNVDLKVMGQYFCTTYLAKAVWKLSGHRENPVDKDEEAPKYSKIGMLCCLDEINNSHRPRVYDFKDVVGVQGAFLSLPSLFLLTLTLVRSQGQASFNEEKSSFEYDQFDLWGMPVAALVLAFVSSVLSPLLGDWETFEKSVKYSVGSFFFRITELVARITFYAFFLDASKFSGFLALLGEFGLMWLTYVNARDTSSAGRTACVSHKILACWESVFFTRFRRVHVDKELIMENNTLMPMTIEFVRFVGRAGVTVFGYLVMLGTGLPQTYLSADYGDLRIPFFVGVATNAAVILFNLANFLVINRSELKASDVGKLTAYWATLPCLSALCAPKVVHINRDNINFQADSEPIHYI